MTSRTTLRRRAAALLTAGALALTPALAGCGRDEGGTDDDAAVAPVARGPAKGTLTVWAMGTEGEKLDVLANDFKAQNPEVDVKVTAVPWDAAHDKIATSIAAGQTPDVSLLGTTWMGEFANALDPTPDLIEPDRFFRGAWDTTNVKGTSYGIPWYVETRLLFYRTDLAAKAGVKPPATWDELKAMAKGLQQAGAKWGIYLQPGTQGAWQTFMPFAWQNGAEIMKGDQFTLDTPQMREALEFYRSFFAEKLSQSTLLAPGALESEFARGAIGSFVSGPWHMGLVEQQGGAGFKDRYAVAPMPKQKSGTSFIGGGNLVVFKNTKNRDTAWKFVEYLSRPEVQVKWYQTVTDLPSVEEAWNAAPMKADQRLATFGKQLEDAKAPPSIPTWEQIANALDAEIEKVVVGGTAPADAAKAMQAQAQSIGLGR
jgi:multiple sugar transport system substrate-binding protein